MTQLIRATIVDMETAPLDDTLLGLLKPSFAAARNLKDPSKIEADLAEKEASWRERAALSALTGKILAIGLLTDETPRILTGPEPAMLDAFWDEWNHGGRIIGFNIKEFDMRFAVTRSRILGVKVPDDLWEGRYWSHRIIDLQEVVCCYSRDIAGHSLAAVCRACGLGEKSGSGADFHKLFTTDRQAALDYLAKDLELSHALAVRLGVIGPQTPQERL